MWKTFLLPVLFLFAYQFGYSQNDNDIRLANEYYTKGEVEKAKILYEQIAHDLNKIPQIHNNYFYLLLSTNDFKTAEKYIERLIKKFSGNLYYRLDMGLLYKAENKEGTADKYFKSIIDEIATNAYLVRHASNYFVTNQLHDYSVLAFAKSRLVLQNPYLYSLELANLHRILGNRDKMVEEYLNYITSNPSNIRYVKNTLQNLLTETEELESLENLLYSKIQDDPSNTVYPELLIWVNLQQKNFYGAYIQARAIDKRLQQEGNNSIDIGIIALDNGDFKTASIIFSWIVENFQGTQNYYRARMYLIQSYEMRVKNSYPVNKEEIRKVINDYQKLISELGKDKSSLDAMRNKAILHAFYMDEKDSAISILNKVINAPIGNVTVKSQSKLDLGDIYLLQGEFWESTLLYSQVEKERKESPLAYEAKLKNAKLSYYRGDFLLAQEHLDIIKEATTREIANDAMDLSLLIKENSAFDSTEMAMKRYAAI
ncbi:MAG: hypothetical protein OEW75_08095, partial [Cyclobacteriaceae bacterium]|nr:hypothetical protein [Cyclobacteriaceae bacterium]